MSENASDDAIIQRVREAVFAQSQRERGIVSGSGLYYPSIEAARIILNAAISMSDPCDRNGR